MWKPIALLVVLGATAAAFYFSGADERGAPAPRATRAEVGEPLLRGEVRTGTGSATIRGVVLSATGPITGATLIAVRIDAEENLAELACGPGCPETAVRCRSGAADAQVIEWASARRGEAPPVARTTSRAGGVFELTGLETGGHRIWAFADGLGVALAQDVRAGATNVELGFGEQVEVRGKVVDARGDPVPGLLVTGFHPQTPRYFDTRTKSDGTFDFGRLPAGPFSIVAEGPSLSVHRHVTLGGDEALLRIALASGVPARVVVLRDTQPVPDAIVEVREGVHVGSWKTGSAGETSVTLPREVMVLVVATSGGAAGRRLVDEHDAEAGPVVIELGDARWVNVIVRNERGEPVPGARVEADAEHAVSGPDGRLRLGPLQSEREATLRVRAPGYSRSEQLVDVSSEGEAVIVLRRGNVVSGVVRAADGSPIRDARVQATEPGQAGELVTGPDGRFELAIDAASVTLVALHPIWGRAELEVTAPAHGVELRMPAGTELEVTVVDERDRPLWLVVRAMPDLPISTAPEASREGHTDREGHVAFKGLAPGAWAVFADERQLTRGIATVEVHSGGKQSVRVVAAQGLRIEGQVTSANGEPQSGLVVRAELTDRPGPSFPAARNSQNAEQERRRPRANTDLNGRFVLTGLEPGTWRMFTRIGNGEASATVSAGAVDAKLVLPAGKIAAGRFLDEQGRAVTRFQIDARRFESSAGTFRAEVTPDQKQLVVLAAGFPTALVDLPAEGGSLIELGTITLRAGRRVRVTVVDKASLASIAGARVGADLESKQTSADGTAVLEGLASDRAVSIWVNASGHARATALAAPGATEVRVELEQAGAVEGAVFLADGGPAPGGQVELVLVGAPNHRRRGTLDNDGSFQIDGLPAGTWEAGAELGRGRLNVPAQRVAVVAGQTAHLVLREPGGAVQISVKFVDARADPLPLVTGILVPGEVAPPQNLDSLRPLFTRGQRIKATRPEVMVAPGTYTVVGLVPNLSAAGSVFSFADRIVVDGAGQSFSLTVPARLVEVTR